MSAEDDLRRFLTESHAQHIEHIRTGQARRFEILRYTFAGFFAYFAFLLSVDDARFLCVFSFETIVVIPGFLLLQVFLYIWIANWNIAKHAAYIDYLFREGLGPLGLGPNRYQNFLDAEYYPRNKAMQLISQMGLHSSQGVLAVLAIGCVVLYLYVERHGGVGLFVSCQ